MSNTITGRNKNKGTYALLPSEDVDNYPVLHDEERKALKQLPTMKSKSQLKQDKDFLKLQTDKFDQNLKIALGQDEVHNRNTPAARSQNQLYELIKKKGG